jgi:hypothetical protein
MGFVGTKTLLTATHFHFAGFGACTLAGLVARAHGEGRGAGVLRVGVVTTIGGIALLAAGITLSRALELVAAWIVAASIVTLGAFLVVHAVRTRELVTRVCLALAGLSTLVSMAFGVRFALQGFAQLTPSSLAEMLEWHGAVNALGFVGLGIFAFSRSSALTAARAAAPAP